MFMGVAGGGAGSAAGGDDGRDVGVKWSSQRAASSSVLLVRQFLIMIKGTRGLVLPPLSLHLRPHLLLSSSGMG